MQKRVYGHKKQGAGLGHTKIQGKSLLVRCLNALAATISTPLAAPVIAGTGLRGGTANSALGAARLTGSFAANAAWLTCAAMAHNLLRAAGALASLACGRARGATIRRDLIDVAARTARHGRGHLTLHLPEAWHREHEWTNLFTATCGPPAAAA